jgi:long-chain acyl-CoA synthetase
LFEIQFIQRLPSFLWRHYFLFFSAFFLQKYEKLTLGEYSWMTFQQWGNRARHLGAGMQTLTSLSSKDRIVIYAETQRDWMTAALAAYHHNLSVVTAYATLGADAAAFAINQTKAKVVVADAKLLPIVVKVIGQCPTLKAIITITPLEAGDKTNLENLGLAVSSIDELVEIGKTAAVPVALPTREDVAMIMYTSGTTGECFRYELFDFVVERGGREGERLIARRHAQTEVD